MFNKQNVPIIVASIGFGVFSIGIFLACYGFPKIVDMKIKEGISMEKGTESYDMWEVTPFPLVFKVHIFNVENPEEVQQGAKPIVREVGPYVYDQYRRKEKVVINEETDTITYILRKTFKFNQEKSGCRTVEDEVVVLNAALVGTAIKVQGMFPSALGTVSDAVPYLFPGIQNIFLKVKVKDLLFDGVLLDCSAREIDFVCAAMKSTVPETVRQHENDQDFLFSMFHHMNDTEEGPYVIGRGMKNTTRGQIYEYKDFDSMDEMWRTPLCNMLNGTDSTMFPPMEEPSPIIYMFSSDLCRSAYIEFEKKSESLGIPTFRYSNTERMLDTLEENDCYCPLGRDEQFKTILKCTPKGTMNLMPCMQAPTIYSNPHFYMGDRNLLNYVTGLNPQKELHENFAEIEPLTGTPVDGMKRAQFSLFVSKIEDFEILSNVTSGYLPMLWLEEGATLPPHLADKLRGAHTALYTLDIVKWLIITIGLILIVVAIILYLRKDKIFCFSDTRVSTFNEPMQTRQGGGDKPAISNSNNSFNSTLAYPSLYPQLVNRNMNKKLTDDRFLM